LRGRGSAVRRIGLDARLRHPSPGRDQAIGVDAMRDVHRGADRLLLAVLAAALAACC